MERPDLFYSNDGKSLLEADKEIERCHIKEGTEVIGLGAFSNCFKLKEVVIPDTVIRIDQAAFGGCSSLESIVIPKSVRSIGIGAFLNCLSLKNVYIRGRIESIGSEIFAGCNGSLTVYIKSQAYWDLLELLPRIRLM